VPVKRLAFGRIELFDHESDQSIVDVIFLVQTGLLQIRDWTGKTQGKCSKITRVMMAQECQF
jgi:hypothetical protein